MPQARQQTHGETVQQESGAPCGLLGPAESTPARHRLQATPGTHPHCLLHLPCLQHADDTAAAVDVPEVSSAQTDKAAPTPAEAAVPEMQSSTPLPSGSAAVAGLTPASEFVCCAEESLSSVANGNSACTNASAWRIRQQASRMECSIHQEAFRPASPACTTRARITPPTHTLLRFPPCLPTTTLLPTGDSPAAAFGPSPVQPIKLDSLWTPAIAQQDANNTASPYAGFSPLVGGTTATQSPSPAAASVGGCADPSGMTPESSGVDLAAMFISTPAAAAPGNGSGSPIAGVVADVDSAAAAAAAAAGSHQQETPSANDSVLMASPALPGAFAFAGVPAAAGTPGAASPQALPAAQQGGDAPAPSAPLLPPAGTPGTPGWSVDTELPPAGEAQHAAGGSAWWPLACLVLLPAAPGSHQHKPPGNAASCRPAGSPPKRGRGLTCLVYCVGSGRFAPVCAGSPSLDTLPGSTPAAAAAAGATPGSVRGGLRSAAKRTPGAAGCTPAARGVTPGGRSSLSPMMDSSPMPAAGPPDLSDTESPLPPASSPLMQVRICACVCLACA